jgi:PLP dependent protein
MLQFTQIAKGHFQLTSHAIDKCKPLTSTIPNLFLVSSVDSQKKATQLDKGRAELHSSQPSNSSLILGPLNIHIQINTSGEESKSGVTPGAEATELARHILKSCPHLNLLGLMTIGAIARSKAVKEGEENEDFICLREERDRLEKEMGDELKGKKLELSMGMSDDFEGAIQMGSDEVRVGSTIFGERPAKEDFKVKGQVDAGKS